MKFKTTSCLASMALLTACGASQKAEITQACSTIMADPMVSGELKRESITVVDFCDCASVSLLAMESPKKGKAISAFLTMADQMGENGGSAENVFSEIRRAGRADDATPEAKAAYEDMDELGEQLEDIVDRMASANGQCVVGG